MDVHILFFKVTIPLVVAVFLFMSIGVLITLPTIIKLRLNEKRLKKQLKAKEKATKEEITETPTETEPAPQTKKKK